MLESLLGYTLAIGFFYPGSGRILLPQIGHPCSGFAFWPDQGQGAKRPNGYPDFANITSRLPYRQRHSTAGDARNTRWRRHKPDDGGWNNRFLVGSDDLRLVSFRVAWLYA